MADVARFTSAFRESYFLDYLLSWDFGRSIFATIVWWPLRVDISSPNAPRVPVNRVSYCSRTNNDRGGPVALDRVRDSCTCQKVLDI